jgi:pyocin large subunit-like protein
MYDPKTNTFMATMADGTPKTMFRPSGNGMAYWQKQLQDIQNGK